VALAQATLAASAPARPAASRRWLSLWAMAGVVLALVLGGLAMKHRARQASAAQAVASPATPQRDMERFRAEVQAQFREADSNGDGYLSAEEMARFPFLAREFARIDADGDGRISPAEFERARLAQLERRFAKRAN
jgi:hypothetical protein